MQDFDQMLRDEIERNGVSIYQLFRETDLHTASLFKFMGGGSLRSDKLSILAGHLGFELRKIDQPKTIKKGK